MANRYFERFRSVDKLTGMPEHTLLHVIGMPAKQVASPVKLILRRFVYALGLIIAVALIVYFDKGGYTEPLTFIDALYYSAVSLSTTGYGDITPVTQQARLLNIIIITPLRLLFVVLLVGTTLSVLTEESRKAWQIQRWRKRLRNHTVVIGYGTKGRSAVAALLADGVPPKDIVVVDTDQHALELAASAGLVTVTGTATKSDVLRLAGVPKAKAVVVAPNLDDTAVLVTLSVRELAPSA